jgi:hypothetical protein
MNATLGREPEVWSTSHYDRPIAVGSLLDGVVFSYELSRLVHTGLLFFGASEHYASTAPLPRLPDDDEHSDINSETATK